MKIKFISYFFIIFLATNLLNLVLNISLFKNYKISFEVYTDDIPRVETIAFNQKNIDHPLYSSIRYSRTFHDRIEVYLFTNDVENGKFLIDGLHKDFKNYILKQVQRYFDLSKQYFEIDSYFSDWLLVENFFLYRDKTFNEPLKDSLDILDKNIEDIDLKDTIKEFQNFLINEENYSLKNSKDISKLIAFASLFYNLTAIGDVEVKTINKKYISWKEILLVFIFSIIAAGYISIKKKNKFL